MPTRFEGSLLVKKIHGRYGPFCIGELVTDIGEFKVKDPVIVHPAKGMELTKA